jgi:hypothetical protein
VTQHGAIYLIWFVVANDDNVGDDIGGCERDGAGAMDEDYDEET